MGSKNRYAKEILPIILADRTQGQWYVEPFCGGCNVIDKVEGRRIANDINYYLIQMWRALVNKDWLPPKEVTEEEYQDIRVQKDFYPPELVGFVGIGCCYSGKWFGGYARGNANNGNPRNYCNESRRNVLSQVSKLKGVLFSNKEYFNYWIPNNSIVYCDPPYENVTKYKNTINYKVYWSWVRGLVAEGHTVFVSEYNAPDDFECIWSKVVNNTLVKETGSKQGIEKLFKYKGI